MLKVSFKYIEPCLYYAYLKTIHDSLMDAILLIFTTFENKISFNVLN